LASAYPSIGQNRMLPRVTATATTEELKKNRGKSRLPKRRSKLFVVGFFGRNVGVLTRNSACGLSEPRSIQRNGPTISSRPIVRRA
jgi:hypothetical protein